MNPRLLRVAGPVILVAVSIIAVVAGLAFGGGAAPGRLADAGPVVRWGLPIATVMVNLAAATMIGSLVLALFALPAGERPFEIALDTASIGAALFTVAAAVTGYMTFLNVLNATPTLDAVFGQQLGRFLVESPPGQAWLITTIAGAVLTVLTFAVRSWIPTLIVAILAIASLIPMGTQGHSGTEASHDAAVTSLVLHIIAAAAWLGGLILLVVVRPAMSRGQLQTTLLRYSSIALVAFIVVAVSGTVRASIGLLGLENLWSAYGVLVLVKVVALVAMGVLGAWYRRRLISRMADEPGSARFWGVVSLELVFMGIASGVAAALARTPPPAEAPLVGTTPAEVLTGAPLPPELTLERWFTAWNVDLLWTLLVAFGLFFYLAGVWRLLRRGDTWPIHRTVLWCLGLFGVFWVTSGPINVYQDYLFSMHMIGHMLLSMAIPLMLVFGAPVSLAARAIRKRDDGSRGGREWILWAVHNPVASVLTNPYVAAGLFIGSLWAFYYTDLFRWSLYDHVGHIWMVAHFLVTGYLFVLSLVGTDPVPFRLPYPMRLLVLIAIMAMHAFFGIAIMMNSGLMVSEWFGAMGRTWGATPLEDQYVGGGVAWSVGEIPTLILAITVAIQWSRSDERQQKRRDRHVDRVGDLELDAYNEELARLAARDARVAARGGS
ncbi:cytochrome c oxidase assembly factor CtaG/putative copper export protein [Microbacterium sp. SORGH_AS 1204]|uniref:cytochrome c oxidase assembly protein n=1 Tax=Microbacterium sp. SORGH_AS_1204 TaxID=3041785 RepID=UPI002790640C|nr:cytochrome c oxidase assembly protein [Microbacterium sp. SORGH_AS_1204]MDQ1135237.1 cytochrome c oxidase assembly factor CtaG/putative copper export protein [Microbacterium sp. SORGH_AS_1204]